MKKLQKEKYSDHEQIYQKIISEKNNVHERLVGVSLEYIRKVSGKLKNDDFFALRNSLTLRLDSIFYHYDLLCNLNISGVDKRMNSMSTLVWSNVSIKQGFLFDSIIFNAISFFDYLSCFISYIAFRKKKSQWQSLANKARTIEPFNSTKLAKNIDALDRFLVSKLNTYRSDLIHYSKDSSSVKATFKMTKNLENIEVYAPKSFSKKFKKEFGELKDKEVSINTAMLWVLETITDDISLLLEDLDVYIEENRLIPKGEEIITYKNE